MPLKSFQPAAPYVACAGEAEARGGRGRVLDVGERRRAGRLVAGRVRRGRPEARRRVGRDADREAGAGERRLRAARGRRTGAVARREEPDRRPGFGRAAQLGVVVVRRGERGRARDRRGRGRVGICGVRDRRRARRHCAVGIGRGRRQARRRVVRDRDGDPGAAEGGRRSARRERAGAVRARVELHGRSGGRGAGHLGRRVVCRRGGRGGEAGRRGRLRCDGDRRRAPERHERPARERALLGRPRLRARARRCTCSGAAARGRAVDDVDGRAPGEREPRDGDRLAGDGERARGRGGVAGGGGGRRRCAPRGGDVDRDRAARHPTRGSRIGEGERVPARRVADGRRRSGHRAAAVRGRLRDRRRRRQVDGRAEVDRALLELPGDRARRGACGRAGTAACARAVDDVEGRAGGEGEAADGDRLAGDGERARGRGGVAGGRPGRGRCAPAGGDVQRDRAVGHPAGRCRVGEGDAVAGRRRRDRRRPGRRGPRAVRRVLRDRRGRREARERADVDRALLRLPGDGAGRCARGRAGAAARGRAVHDGEGGARGEGEAGDGDRLAGDGERSCGRGGVAGCGTGRRGCAPGSWDVERDRAVRHPARRRRVGKGDRVGDRGGGDVRARGGQRAGAVRRVLRHARLGGEVRERAAGRALLLRRPRDGAGGRRRGRAGTAARRRAVGDRGRRAAGEREVRDDDRLAGERERPGRDSRVARRGPSRRRGAPRRRDCQAHLAGHEALCRRGVRPDERVARRGRGDVGAVGGDRAEAVRRLAAERDEVGRPDGVRAHARGLVARAAGGRLQAVGGGHAHAVGGRVAGADRGRELRHALSAGLCQRDVAGRAVERDEHRVGEVRGYAARGRGVARAGVLAPRVDRSGRVDVRVRGDHSGGVRVPRPGEVGPERGRVRRPEDGLPVRPPEFCALISVQPPGAVTVALFRTAISATRMSPTLPGRVIVSEVVLPAELAVLNAVRAMFGSITYGTGRSASSSSSASVQVRPDRSSVQRVFVGVTFRRPESKIAAG